MTLRSCWRRFVWRNMITFGSPHQGVFGVPECEAEVSFDIKVFLHYIKVFVFVFVFLGAKCEVDSSSLPRQCLCFRLAMRFSVSWCGGWSLLVLTSPGSRFCKRKQFFSLSENIWFVQTGPCCPSSVLAWPLQPNSLFGKKKMDDLVLCLIKEICSQDLTTWPIWTTSARQKTKHTKRWQSNQFRNIKQTQK